MIGFSHKSYWYEICLDLIMSYSSYMLTSDLALNTSPVNCICSVKHTAYRQEWDTLKFFFNVRHANRHDSSRFYLNVFLANRHNS